MICLTASTSTLDGTNESLQQTKKDIDALCIQLGVDQVSAKYFLTSMQQHSTAINNISWQVTGNKSQVNPTLKELCRDLNDKINTGNRRLAEIKEEKRAQHEQTLQYLKGIESAVDRMVTALGQVNVVTAAPVAPGVTPTGVPVGPGVASTGVPVGAEYCSSWGSCWTYYNSSEPCCPWSYGRDESSPGTTTNGDTDNSRTGSQYRNELPTCPTGLCWLCTTACSAGSACSASCAARRAHSPAHP